jgi:hypothetical protein
MGFTLRVIRAVVACAVFALAGCTGNPGGGCAAAIGPPPPQLVNPVNGATGVPITIGSIMVSGPTFNLPVVLVPAGGSQIQLGTFALIGNTGNSSIAVPTLTPATKYTILIMGFSFGCIPQSPNLLTPIGVFTTS